MNVKTIKTKDGKTITTSLFSFAEQLDYNSMDEGDDEPPLKKRKKSRASSSKNRAGTPPKRRRATADGTPSFQRSPRTLSPKGKQGAKLGSEGNPLFDLLGKNYDIASSPSRLSDRGGRGTRETGSSEEEEGDAEDEEGEDEEALLRRGRSSEQLSRLEKEPRPGASGPRCSQVDPFDDVTGAGPSLLQPSALPKPTSRPDDDDATETESEAERLPVIKRLPPRPAVAPVGEPGSDTEEEDEPLPLAGRQSQSQSQRTRQPSPSGSDTESEGETLPTIPTPSPLSSSPLKPPRPVELSYRPDFVATPDQQLKGDFELETESGLRVPKSIAQFLRPYQEEGVKFFWERYNEGRGGVLGDDMGLGKTIQVIAFLSAIMQKTGSSADENRRYRRVDQLLDVHAKKDLPPANAEWPTCLIIAPKTVVGNWVRELKTWGYFEVGVYDGPQKDGILNSFKMGRYDILLMGHETARNDIDLIDNLKLSCIFVDEAHKIKNPRASITQKYNQFECVVRFGMTGTAIQNTYQEVWALLDWSSPGRVGTEKQWQKYIVSPLTTGQSKDASEKELLEFRDLAERFVTRLLPHFFLRRTKDLIQDQLPKKFDHVVFCPLTETQIDVYKRVLATEEVQLMTRKDEPCDCGSKDPKTGQLKRRGYCHYTTTKGPDGKDGAGTPWSKLVLKYLDVLLKISNSLILIWPGPKDTHEQTKRNSELMKIAFPDGHQKYGHAVFDTELCGKWSVLSNLLQVWKREEKNNKVLVFSKSTKILACLETWLENAGFNYRLLDGEVKQEDRFKRIDDFNLDPDIFVFLISTLTGGTGLNLVAANKVVIFDPNWNPAHDLQAMDRAYRFGQRRDVFVYRLLGAGSLEELVYARQIYKQQQMKIGYTASYQTRLFAGIQGDKDRQGELFGLKNIFALNEELVTKEQIEDAHMSNLEWAFANTLTGPTKNDDDAFDAKKLGSFLLEDKDVELAKAQMTKGSVDDEIKRILNRNGVEYTHENDAILRDNVVEKDIAQAALKGKRARTSKGNPKRKSAGSTLTSAGSVAPSHSAAWKVPPRRPHHTTSRPRIETPHERIMARTTALFKSGRVKNTEDLAKYAQEFSTKSKEEIEKILKELDQVGQGPSKARTL